MKKFLVFLIALFMFGITVKAECLEKEYIDWSSDLKPVFTLYNFNDHMDLDTEKYKYAYFLSLSKQRDDITFNVIDQYNNTMPASHYDEINIYGVGLYNGINEETYKIEVYGNAKGTCNGELITTLSYTVPQYNEFYKTQYCDKYREHELCQAFTNATKDMTRDEFNTTMKEYEDTKKSGILNKIWKFLTKSWVYLVCILVPVIGVSIYYNLKIKRYKKMRNRHEEVRRHKNYLFILLVMCLTIVRVNASLMDCTETITEGPITSAGWATRLKVCEWYNTGRRTRIGPSGSYAGAVAKGRQTVETEIMKADGKGAEEISIPMCIMADEGGPGRVDAVVTTSYSYTQTKCVSCCEGYDANGTPCEKKYDTETIEGTCDDDHEGVPAGFNPTTCGECISGLSHKSNFKCEVSEIKFYASCPIYGCNAVEKTIEGWCNASFKVNGDDAYCVNPSDHFPSGHNNYSVAKFDPTTCRRSTDSTDCGFANILIEAAYYNQQHGKKISYETINFALRLWAGEIGYGGFPEGRPGLAYKKGYDCGEYIAYIKGNKNVYKQSLKYIMNLYFAALSKEGVDTSVESLINSNYFDSIACKPGQLGIVCHGQTDTYVQAFALYFNTLLGNDFKLHLSSLYGETQTEPISATVSSEVIDQYSVVEVKYLEEVTIGEKIECSDIKAKKNKGETLTDDEQKVLNYCNNKITHVIGVKSDGTMVDLATGTVVTDLNGDGVINTKDFLKLPDPEDTGAPVYNFSYCQKNSCFSPTVYFAICDTVKTGEERYETIYTTIRYTESSSRYSVKKYIACGPADSQVMFSYDEGEHPGKTWDETTSEDLAPVKTVTVDFYCYDGAGCNNYSLRQGEECASKSGGHGTAYVKDPSLSCILNMSSPVAKNSYDYTDYFGVNEEFCKIYCSDSAEYYMANKVDIYSGLSFKLDIEYDVFKNNKSKRALSNVVLMKRDCVSKIFYDNNEFESNTDWTKIYEKLSTNPKNWKELYANLQKYGEAAGHINQVKYDLYNCNLYSNIPVSRPKDNKIGNVYSRIKELFSKDNSYGFNGEKYGYNLTNNKLSDTENDVVYSDIKYNGGAYYVNTKTRVGAEYGDIKLSHELNNHNSYSGNVSPVTYCKGDKCFAYDPSGDEYKMPHEYGNGTGRTISTTQGTGIPTNDYAYFSIVTEIDFYNDSKFQVEPYTGNVSDVTNKAKDNDYLDLDPYLYPVSKDASVECTDKKCGIDFRYQILQTYYRKMGSGTNAFKEAIKNAEFKAGECPSAYYPVPVENKTETVYRNVNISNMFPTVKSDGTRRIGANWENSTAYIEEIENYVAANGEAKYYSTHLEYSYTLTQDAIKKIKEYNAKSAGTKSYVDNTVEKGTCVDSNGTKYDCKSTFITSINSNTNQFGIVNNRQGQKRGTSDYTINKKLKD